MTRATGVSPIRSDVRGEVAALSVADVDLLGRRLHVRRTVARDDRGRTVLAEPKSDAGRRTVAIPLPLVEIIAAHLGALGLTAAHADALLFPSRSGGPMTASNFGRRVWHPAIIAAEIGNDEQPPTFHDLRRTSATGLVAEGVDPKTAQTRLGHSQVRLTLELYAQAVDAADAAASDAIAARLLRPRDGRAMGTGTERGRRHK